jgi:NAD-dependent SIR2 family protein deacetylase
MRKVEEPDNARTGGQNPAHARGGIMEAYCLKCRTQREMSNPEDVTMKNGKPATMGKCPVCGTKMYRIGKK